MSASHTPGPNNSFLETKIPPPAVMASCALLAWLTHQLFPFALLTTSDQSWPLTNTLALLIFAIGLSTDLVSLKRFFSAKTTINPLKPQKASHLVTSGIYRFTRNPMYVGLMLWLVALAVYLNNPLCLIWPLVFSAYITRFQILPEEKFLKELFGEEYLAYLQSTPRWLFFK